MALGWRRQKRSPPAVRTSPSSVAARREPALRRLASGRRRQGGERRWRHSSPTFSSQASVRGLAAEVLARYPKLDVLVNNVGAMYGTWQLTNDGIELTWAVNHLATWRLRRRSYNSVGHVHGHLERSARASDGWLRR